MIESDCFVRWHNARAREAATSSASVVFVNLSGAPVVSLEDSRSGIDPYVSAHRVVCRKPCRGLLLVSWSHNQGGDSHALCNPVLTRDVRSFQFPGYGHGCAGLGYDRSREEHVLVRILRQQRLHETMECAVWRLRDLSPRRLASRPPIPVAVDVPPVHVGGKMYWPGKHPSRDAVLAFDICAEEFEILPAPPTERGDRVILTELAGKLCAAHLSRATETMTVWGRNSVDGHWTREHVIELQQWPEFSLR
ncbi:hypothetical protein EJB05_00287, partial [Eragrostis curvula]